MDFLRRAGTFVQVAEAGSLSRAARSLRVSLSAISRQIAALEAELGARLLVRTTRSLRLTDEGQLFLQHATRLLSEEAEARASVRPELAVAGRLVVSASVTLGVVRMVPKLPELLARHPGLRLELRLEDRAVDIAAEGIDIAVRGGRAPPDTASLVAREVANYRCFVVASETYLRAHAPRRLWTSWRAMRRSWGHRRRAPGLSSEKRRPSRFPSTRFSGSGRSSGFAPLPSPDWAWPFSPTS